MTWPCPDLARHCLLTEDLEEYERRRRQVLTQSLYLRRSKHWQIYPLRHHYHAAAAAAAVSAVRADDDTDRCYTHNAHSHYTTIFLTTSVEYLRINIMQDYKQTSLNSLKCTSMQYRIISYCIIMKQRKTSSSAVAKRPRCFVSVSSSLQQTFIVSHVGYRFITACS